MASAGIERGDRSPFHERVQVAFALHPGLASEDRWRHRDPMGSARGLRVNLKMNEGLTGLARAPTATNAISSLRPRGVNLKMNAGPTAGPSRGAPGRRSAGAGTAAVTGS
jgi:hypothetical protein